MPAPLGYWSFRVLDDEVGVEEMTLSSFSRVFPNPANAITCVEMNFKRSTKGRLFLTDVAGRTVMEIHNGKFDSGVSKYFIDASRLSAGMYYLALNTEGRVNSLPLMVK